MPSRDDGSISQVIDRIDRLDNSMSERFTKLEGKVEENKSSIDKAKGGLALGKWIVVTVTALLGVFGYKHISGN